jgi:hypothetical protein
LPIELYYQLLCRNGHYDETDAKDLIDLAEYTCEICGEPLIWYNIDDDDWLYSRIELEVDDPGSVYLDENGEWVRYVEPTFKTPARGRGVYLEEAF